ncbi:glycosyltransferase [Aridibaculum aurantiacum]|uniref:glycosyltransferase n=1 Tax=Aridibaculum aurantiacum TaxID=2810307 RepID=UPI001A96B5F2|nr:glycosyltransferase [Aridibaculum aurantiacum]
MKVMHCFFTMQTGGAQVLAVDVLNKMSEQHQTYLVVVNDLWSQDILAALDKKVEVILVKREEGSRNPFPILRLNYIIKKIRPDIIHCHENKLAKILFTKRRGMIFTVHDVGLDLSCLLQYTGVTSISNSVHDDVLSRYNINTEIVYNGIPFEKVTRRIKYSLCDGEQIKFVQISRLVHEKKGQMVLIEAFKQLINECSYNICLDFVGDGPSYTFLLEQIRDYGLENRISLVGAKSRDWIFSNLHQYHALVQPSFYEGFGLTVVEGVAAGLPVVASKIEGPLEILEQTNKPLLFEPGNVEECAAMLKVVIHSYQNNVLQSVMNENYMTIQHKFSIDNTVNGFLEIYKSNLINRR